MRPSTGLRGSGFAFSARGGDMLSGYAGLRILEDPNLIKVVEDWSEVRSPARARRRRKRGFRQRIQYHQVPSREIYRTADALIMHPATARELLARLAQADNRGER